MGFFREFSAQRDRLKSHQARLTDKPPPGGGHVTQPLQYSEYICVSRVQSLSPSLALTPRARTATARGATVTDSKGCGAGLDAGADVGANVEEVGAGVGEGFGAGAGSSVGS